MAPKTKLTGSTCVWHPGLCVVLVLCLNGLSGQEGDIGSEKDANSLRSGLSFT